MSRLAEVFNLNDGDDQDYLDFGSSEPVPAKPAPIVSTKGKKKAYVPYKAAKDLPDVYDDEKGESIVSKEKANKKVPLKNVQEHQLLINQLNAFAASARFAPVLKECEIKIKDLSKKTLSELKELRERVRACCANSGGSGGIVSAVTLGICGKVEAWAPSLDGYQAALESNPEFAALCEMIEIDSGFKSSMNPMQRMAMCLGTTAMTVSGTNKMKALSRNANEALLANLRAQQQSQTAAAVKPPSAAIAAPAIVAPEDGVRVY
jgi:hypothetical protein